MTNLFKEPRKRLFDEQNFYRNDMLNTFTINYDDFEYLMNLYRFKPNKEHKTFVDLKRNMTVAKIQKNIFDRTKQEIIFDADWLYKECITTKSKPLVSIMRNYPELTGMYDQYKLTVKKENERFKRLMERYSLQKHDFDEYEEDEYA